MPNTVVLDAYSKAYPSITNRIRASVSLSSDPMAIVASIIDTTSGHPARIWHFPGLLRTNYDFSLDEIDGGGSPVNNLAKFSVVPGQIDGSLIRGDEQIRVGTTTGFDAGLSTVTFDGTGGKPNYIGWQITPSELTGRGILVRGLDYSWDTVTGVMTWLQTGDVLQDGTNYNIHFDPIAAPVDSSPVATDFSIRLVTGNDNVALSDFGNTIIVEPEGIYLELSLPDILTAPQGRPVTIETVKALGNTVQCVKIIPNGADTINFGRGALYMMNNESFQLYRFKRDDVTNEWRVRLLDGNFNKVGESVVDDFTQSGVFCKQLLDGSSKDKFQYARIYNEVVLNLPGTQVCNYDDWATGNNKYLYSLANSADLGNADKFHFPDRRGLFERSNNSGKAGDYFDDTVGPHTHIVAPPGANNQSGYGKCTTGSTPLGTDGPIVPFNTSINNLAGAETQPKHTLINKYVLI